MAVEQCVDNQDHLVCVVRPVRIGPATAVLVNYFLIVAKLRPAFLVYTRVVLHVQVEQLCSVDTQCHVYDLNVR